ncbi:MAG: magnesium/cobalt transporter CorA [Phycisphaerae bacterium]|nr:magnesium/cobalt transporter CorA [Phycisphaerae bacterium]
MNQPPEPSQSAQRRRRKAYLPPGSLVSSSNGGGEPVGIYLCQYGRDSYLDSRVESADGLAQRLSSDTGANAWITVEGIHDAETIESIGRQFQIHPLVLEDIMDSSHQPKVEDHEQYLFVIAKHLQWSPDAKRLQVRQVSMILMDEKLIVFQESKEDIFAPIRERLRSDRGRIRRMGADYLLHAVLDTLVDGYFLVLEDLSDAAVAMETAMETDPSEALLHSLHRLRRQGILVRKAVWPLREAVSALARRETRLIREETDVYMRDLYDHAVQVIEATETLRELLSGLLDLYLSSMSNRMNAVMKVLTIIATIFIPLTFLAGIYGMNFKYMPELDWPWAYPALLGVMLVVAVVMLMFFRRKKWL